MVILLLNLGIQHTLLFQGLVTLAINTAWSVNLF